MPQKGHFVLHSNVLPPVTAGRYEFVSKVTGTPFTTREERTQVSVSSPRYTMPPGQILSTFPPANGEGAFGDRLPQIVLKRRTLPWERNPEGGTTVSETPWLALVVVAEAEAELSDPTEVAGCVTPGVALDPTDRDVDKSLYLAVTESVAAKVFPTRDDLPLLVHVREVDVTDTELVGGDDDGWLAVVLANRLPVMDTATTPPVPVRYLACLVNLEGQLDRLPTPSAHVDFFQWELAEDWSVLATSAPTPDHIGMGTGLTFNPASVVGDSPRAPASGPAPGQALGPGLGLGLGLAAEVAGPLLGAGIDGAAGQTAVPTSAHWVAATEQTALAAADPNAQLRVRDTMRAGWHYPINAFALDPVLRFPVLAHWSFTTTEGATFETLMQGLDFGLLGTLEGERVLPPADPAAEPPPEAPPRPAKGQVTETGHIRLDHRTRRGDRGQAWYRGPLVPHPTLRDQSVDGRLPLAHASDQLKRVVPDGREDLSYAAGFEIGRLLALSQLSIVGALLRYRAEQFGRERARQIVDQFVPLDHLLDELGPDLAHFVSLQLVEKLVADPEATIGPPRPIVDPGRPIDLEADLDTIIATGLGLDLAALTKLGTSVGMVTALATTQVPVAEQEVGVLEEATAAMLRQSLDAKVADAVGIALPGGPVVIGAQPVDAQPVDTQPAGAQPPRGGPAAQAPADALDQLIERAPEFADRDPDEP